MAMRELIQKLGPLVLESAAAVSYLRRRINESRPDGAEARLDAIENAMGVQSTLNNTIDVQIHIIHALLEKTQKRLQVVIVALIATGTVAALALALALMK